MTGPQIETRTVKSLIRLRRRTRVRLWVEDRRRRLRLGRDGYAAYKHLEAEMNAAVDRAFLFGDSDAG